MATGDLMLAGSQGKTFVAAVTLGLVEEGVLALDDKAARWLGQEAWFARLPNSGEVTVRQLMTHSSGVPDHLASDVLWQRIRAEPDRTWSPAELLEVIADAPPLFAPGEGWAYADANYLIVGAVIERASGRIYEELLRERILIPERLTSVVPQESRRIGGLADGTTVLGKAFGLEGHMTSAEGGALPFNPQMEWCGGGVAATTADLARWAHRHFSGARLRPDALAAMLDGVPAKTGPGQGYGLGVQLRESDHGPVRFHGGWFPGYMGEMAYYPEHGIALSILVNTDAGVGPRLFQRLFDSLVGRLKEKGPEAR